jgi:hypothetical protein
MPGTDITLLLNDLKEAIGLPEFELDEDGYACLALDEVMLNLEFDEETNRLMLYSPLGEIPASGCEALYETLLEANFLGQQTGGATLGLQREDNAVVLHQAVSLAGVTSVQFQGLLETFVDAAETWMGKLAGVEGTPGSATRSADPSSPYQPPLGIRV